MARRSTLSFLLSIAFLGCGGGGGGGGGDEGGGGGAVNPCAGTGPSSGPAPAFGTWSLDWAKRDGSAGDETSNAVAVFGDGSSVMVGSFGLGTVLAATFGPGDPNQTQFVPLGSADAFVARYHPDGTLAWARRAGGTGYDTAWGVAAFDDGSCVVVGTFMASATFGAGEPNETTLTPTWTDGFVARYAADGSLVWAKQISGPDAQAPTAVAAFCDGSCAVVGGFTGTATLGPGEPGQTVLPWSASQRLFVARYRADGTLAWARGSAGTDIDVATSVSIGVDGEVLVAGFFTLTMTLGSTTLTSPGTGQDLFVAKFAWDGAFLWARRAGGSGPNDQAHGVSATSDGGAFVTGFFTSTATFGPGEPGQTALTAIGLEDFFLARYASDGSLVWVRRAAGASAGVSRLHGNAVATIPGDAAVVTGYFDSDATFGATTLTLVGAADVFVVRYSAGGAMEGATGAGSVEVDEGLGVAALADGTAVVTGRFRRDCTFGAGEPNETILTSAGEQDAFVARYSP